ncbi:biotin--[acetyl-CoA-carboxylase] ligase [Acetivibrio sp. MSJd-27]|uniref:biotin--[acetyl-CoA-carboxylase] ligase n=1 Tax=Acetivibrio sp. MSJd-27 TaxID=2841523 RepID=UPI0015AA7953|nr:biotin--[acetyl-CoA-carboxylase] ligase [Acetivibrio sp. MSJd-27]MBU5449601.1 biotin--[acetyl-CoA-carboxylase] ligase [Acetivibrio sp. MSJd-27]
MTKYRILAFLEKEKNNVISGMEIAQKMGISRNAVWKAVNSLKAEGYPIESIKNGGYCYSPVEKEDILSVYEIRKRLRSGKFGENMKVVPVLDSTNTDLKRIAFEKEDGFVLVSEKQTGGRGRMNRTFLSDGTEGAYFSFLLRPELYAGQLPLLTAAVSLAVAECLEIDFQIKADIKWPNDIFVNGRKICGILTEASVEQESGKVEWVIVGIGVNVNQSCFQGELLDKAISIKMLIGGNVCRADVIAGILNCFEAYYADGICRKEMIANYRKKLSSIGTKRRVWSNGTLYEGKIIGVDEDGRLLVELPDQTEITVMSGELEN